MLKFLKIEIISRESCDCCSDLLSTIQQLSMQLNLKYLVFSDLILIIADEDINWDNFKNIISRFNCNINVSEEDNLNIYEYCSLYYNVD